MLPRTPPPGEYGRILISCRFTLIHALFCRPNRQWRDDLSPAWATLMPHSNQISTRSVNHVVSAPECWAWRNGWVLQIAGLGLSFPMNENQKDKIALITGGNRG